MYVCEREGGREGEDEEGRGGGGGREMGSSELCGGEMYIVT